MKKIWHKIIYEYIFKYRYFISFFLSFCVYLTYGFNIGYDISAIDDDGIFEADCNRVYKDFFFFKEKEYHYRTMAHPLQLIIFQPFFLLIKNLFHSSAASLCIVQALLAAVSVCLIYKILSLWTNYKISALMAIIYGCSFSLLLFSAVPELYLFASISNLLLFLYISVLAKNESDLSDKSKIFVISALSVLSFGIIPVSIIPNFILILWLAARKKNNFIKNIFMYLLFSLIIFLLLEFLQKLSYPEAPAFFKGIVAEDSRFFNFKYNIKKLIYVINGIVFGSLYSLPIETDKYNHLNFILKQNFLNYIPGIVLYGFTLLCFIYKKTKLKTAYNDSLIYVLFLINLLTFVQYYYYCTPYCFLFSLNILMYIIILMGLIFDKCSNKLVSIILYSFISYMCIANGFGMKYITDTLYLNNNFYASLLMSFITTITIALTVIIFKRITNGKFTETETENKFYIFTKIFLFFIITCSLLFTVLKGI